MPSRTGDPGITEATKRVALRRKVTADSPCYSPALQPQLTRSCLQVRGRPAALLALAADK